LDFLKSKFDNLCLFALIMIMLAVLVHVTHDKGDADLLAWVEQAATTVLGAYIGLTQASRAAWNKQGGTNGTTTVASGTTPVKPVV